MLLGDLVKQSVQLVDPPTFIAQTLVRRRRGYKVALDTNRRVPADLGTATRGQLADAFEDGLVRVENVPKFQVLPKTQGGP